MDTVLLQYVRIIWKWNYIWSLKKIKNLLILLIYWMMMHYSKSSTWPSNIPTTSVTTSQQDSFSGYTNVYIEKVVAGPVSGSLYFSYYL